VFFVRHNIIYDEGGLSPPKFHFLVGGGGVLPFTQSQSSSVIGIQLFI
jgi:hypothetical protein